MKIYVFLILIMCCNSCIGKNLTEERDKNEMKKFYNEYNIYKIQKMYDMKKDEDVGIIKEDEDKCIITYLSKEIKNKKTNYQEYLLNLPVNDTDKYDELIIDLTIKSSESLRENWNFMYNYLNNNIKDIERIFEKLNEYDSEDIYSFFLVYFKGYEAPYQDIIGDDYYGEQVKKINKFDKLKNELLITGERFNKLYEWEEKIENRQINFKEENYGELNKYFSVDISDSLSLSGAIYNNKDFILILYETTSYYIPPKLLLKETIDTATTKFYTYGPNFFIIKKSGSESILTKYEYNIKESKLKVLDKVKLENCF